MNKLGLLLSIWIKCQNNVEWTKQVTKLFVQPDAIYVIWICKEFYVLFKDSYIKRYTGMIKLQSECWLILGTYEQVGIQSGHQLYSSRFIFLTGS